MRKNTQPPQHEPNLDPISRAWLARMGQRDIFVPGRYAYSIHNIDISWQTTMTSLNFGLLN
jgi:hypothetical protein